MFDSIPGNRFDIRLFIEIQIIYREFKCFARQELWRLDLSAKSQTRNCSKKWENNVSDKERNIDVLY